MSVINLPQLSSSIQADTSPSPNTVALRDNAGGLAVDTLTASQTKTGVAQGTTSAQTTSFTLGAATDYPVNASGGAVTATMPSPASAWAGVTWWIWKTDSSSNAVTISGASGMASLGSQYAKARIVCDGTTFWCL